ncbi:hypothetical protein [Actinoplanes sp. N902-109]|uniref:hypothetical protein n=1 Tax=Actinoplanes sp. (strain N902-109) TaxID=649831 RepID=UPI0003295415|nr:hypothetical protein [Actinoplanes sp. N902-109]AGL14284.1 hypothetical protein L083_0774 [Actinoplanes sp. N902-109]
MELALQLLGGNSGRVAVIWLTLIVLALAALVGLALPRGVRRPRQISAWLADSAAQKRAEMERRAAEAQEVVRYAAEITVAAAGATATAERRREECQQAQAAVEQAWQAWQDADAALERARRATAYALPESTPAAESDDDRVQALRRAAQAAHRRGDISDEQLLDALTHRNGWDPTLHPVEQELVLARATVEHRFAIYQQALTIEDEAWQAADVATAAIRTLRDEIVVAQARADAARQALPEQARAILDQAGSNAVVVTTQRITAEDTPQRPGTLLESLTGKPAVADVVMAIDAVVTMPIQRPAPAVESADTTVIMTTAAAAAAAETTQVVRTGSGSEATQEVRSGRGRRELPAWTQPTAARSIVAGAR